jgi:hypothetical protein
MYGFDINQTPKYLKSLYEDFKLRNNIHKAPKRNTMMYKAWKQVPQYHKGLHNYKSVKTNRGWNRSVSCRYLNLNLHSWFYRGTVEYRLAAGTVDINDIRMWPIFCLWLTEIASRTSLKIVLQYMKYPDIIQKIIDDSGFMVPAFNGPKIYPISPYLRDWLITKVRT